MLFESFHERTVADGRSLPAFVVREVRALLRCGVRAHGFTRVRCVWYRHEYAQIDLLGARSYLRTTF